MTDFYDDLETRAVEQRDKALFDALPGHVAHAKQNAPYFTSLLGDIDPHSITDHASLARIPVTRKSDLIALQKETPPFGGMTTVSDGRLGRIFSSPGPIYDPQGAKGDFWRFGRAFWAAGFRPGDLVHNTFSYHFTPAGFMMDLAAQAVGCAVFPAGIGQTEMQVQTIADLRPNGYAGTPSFLRIILEKADEAGVDVSSITKASVGGEALLPAVRESLSARGIEVRQSYGTADLGLIAYETEPNAGLIIDEGVIVEIVRPGSDDPVNEGEVGEVVVTNFASEYPLIRFGTGDLSAVLAGQSPCGRTNMRIKGWMGRADQTAKVKGMFVHPSQVDQVTKRHGEIARARLVIEHDEQSNDRMTLQCEVSTSSDALNTKIAETIRDVTKLRSEVAFVESGSLPNDGKVIDDQRKFD
ncbi:MAG: AMP-binding protein [Betaproteobacteria bacterium]|jgi:phenylacetate-CoA ligase|nr:MAG: AMP-binding protein [Betaproteobacteria bacterium]